MVYRGFWNVLAGGQWYQIHEDRGRIFSPEEKPIYKMLKKFQDGVDMRELDKAIPIPFPLPLRHNLSYVYTLDLDSAQLTISFWHNEEDDESPDTTLYMRCLSLSSINEASDLSRLALLQNGSNPLEFAVEQTGEVKEFEYELEHWEFESGQPTMMNELQYRMFTDFTYQWKFFIDDRTIWPSHSSISFRRLCSAFLRLAAWDFEITTEGEKVKLPLGAVDFPAWESPSTNMYWFHGFLVVLCEILGQPSISASITQVKEFVGEFKEGGMGVDCIFLSMEEIAFLQLSKSKPRCSRTFPFLTSSSAKECSPGFRVLTSLLTSRHTNSKRKTRAAREESKFSLPTELLDLVLNVVRSYDLISFAQASFMVEEWYYSPYSLPQLPNMKIRHREISIPCCGKSDERDGVSCAICCVWRHSECIDTEFNPQPPITPYTCPTCLSLSSPANSSPKPKALQPGAISRANRGSRRPKGLHVHRGNPTEEKALQLRTTSPAVQRPELRMMDRDLSFTPLNEINYVVLFGGVWTGLAYGLDDLDPMAR